MKDSFFPTLLNAEGLIFVRDQNNQNGGYPMFEYAVAYDVTTEAATGIDSYHASLQGHFSGGADSMGIACWPTANTLATQRLFVPATEQSLSLQLDSLEPSTQYSYVFYVKRDFIYTYGDTLTFTTRPLNIVSAAPNNNAWGSVSGGGHYAYGDTAVLTATPIAPSLFKRWSDGVLTNPRAVTVTQDTLLQAVFGFETFLITGSSSNPDWGSVGGSGEYDLTFPFLLTAYPETGHHFVYWIENTTGEQYYSNPLTALTDGNHSFTAVFALDQYTVTVAPNDTAKGLVTGGGTFDYGQQVYIVATPKGSNTFQQWSDGDTNAYRLVTVQQDILYTAIFVDARYPLLALSNNDQYGTVTGSGTYQVGSSVTLTAIPLTGYRFTQWNDGDTTNPRTVTVTGAASYMAQFAARDFVVTVTSADSLKGEAVGGGSCTYLTQMVVTAIPAAHCHFLQWSDGNTLNPRVVNVASDTSLVAQFALNEYTVTATSANGAQGTASGSGSYTYGTSATVTATPAAHYHFLQWSDGNTDNPRTVTVAGDVTYTAQFAIDQHTLTVASADSTQGSANGGGTFAYGAEATVTASPTTHYHFLQWSDGNTLNPRVVTVTSDTSLVAQFALNEYTVTATSANLSQGTASGSGSYTYGTSATVTATPAAHYHFLQWSDGDTDNPRTVTVAGDVTYTAQFAIDQHTLTVATANVAQGTVSGGGTFAYGAEATVTASPTTHYHFQQWNDGNTTNPRVVTVSSDTTFTAQFAENQYNLTVVSADATQGAVSGSGIYTFGAEAVISASPMAHHRFLQWGDGNSDNPRTVTVTGEATYTAQFAIDIHTITATGNDAAMGMVTGGGDYAYGTQITLLASAMPRHHFLQWNDGVGDNPRTIVVSGDSTFTAQFEQDPQYTLTVVSDDPTRGTVSGGGSFYGGEYTVISATANEGNVFDHWSDGSTESHRTVTVTDNVTYTAYFVPLTYTVNVYSNDDNLGVVSGDGTYEYEGIATVTATPADGCRFVRWNNGVEANPYTFTVYSDVNLIATFERTTGIGEVESGEWRVESMERSMRVVGAEGQAVTVYDALGRQVYTSRSYQETPIALPAAGVYMVRVNGKVKKLVAY